MKKIVFGILASTNEHYSQFMEIWIENIKKFKQTKDAEFIDFYFIYSEPHLSKILVADNPNQPVYYHYYSQYNENDSMMDSFLNRTVCLLDQLQLTPFDYFIRTNLSTLFHLNILLQCTQQLPTYNFIAGSPIDKINSLYTHMSGTNIILSRDLADFLLLNREYLLKESILHGDDQRISSLIIENINVNLLVVKRLDFIEMTYNDNYLSPTIVFQSCYDTNNLFCYRFKTTNRENDIKYMKMLQEHIYLENFNIIEFISSLVYDNPDTPYKQIACQNKDYDKLTHTIFQIQTNSEMMKTYHRYKSICLKYLPTICTCFPNNV